ncbi:ATP-binding protein [Archangium primigenium]|uniref:sensor histidine kinase n=1 Tax=[Archangium] primigenium TaxID=2792470 RepID=UPI0019568705|nr:ATP-binding protein [Archangium primigenium]MBM7113827.1 GAF domain-containing protein [Archangium primigenium]
MSEYQPFNGLPVPVLVVRGERIHHANAALLSLLGVSLEDALATPVLMLLARFSPAQLAWLEPALSGRALGAGGPPDSLWVHLRVAGGAERTFRMCRGEGLREEDTVLMLLDAEGEESTRRLTESLVAAAAELVHCRDEPRVLETAVEAIHRHGFSVMTLLLDDDGFQYGPLRQPHGVVTACERRFGQPLRDIRVPRTSLPHVEEVWSRRKAAFHTDFPRLLGHPVRRGLAEERPPAVRVLDAPIFVEGQPHGILSVQGESLTPTSAATLELFARQVGGALENVRHHRRAAERLAELSRLQSELVAQERLAVLGEAAGVVAHEVRNPLGAILNAVAVVKRERLGPVGRSALEMLEEEATRLDAMVKDLLDVVRPLEPRPRPLHPGELARRTLEILGQRRQLGTLRVSMDEAPNLPTLQGDEFLLQLALENLLRNAVQACPPESGVKVGVSSVPEGILLSVEDEGPGISPEDMHRVFEPFFTTRATGTGLGLAVVRRVVMAHGGTVSVRPRPGGGARFELRLPLHTEARPLGYLPMTRARD